MKTEIVIGLMVWAATGLARAERNEWWKPYGPNQTERENVFAFAEKPAVKQVGPDRYEIRFAVASKGGSADGGYCDVTVAIVDPDPAKEIVKGRGVVVRHLAAGVLGANAPAPFQKNSLEQTLYWDGKDDLDWYHKEPEKLRVRVSLGLNPVFDKLLGGTHPKVLPGRVFGLGAGPEGVHVFSRGGSGTVYIRKFDLDGRYRKSLLPPPSGLAESKLDGRSFVEYEPGKRPHHGPHIHTDLGWTGICLPGLDDSSLTLQSVVANGRLYYGSAGPGMDGKPPSLLHYIGVDGSTDVNGLKGRPLIEWRSRHELLRFAASPDGQWLYMTGLGTRGQAQPVVLRIATAGDKPAEVFIGEGERRGVGYAFEPGSDHRRFNDPQGIATDAAGRVYVADKNNNRIQIFSPEGQYLKTISLPGVTSVQVHKKNGAIYAQHGARVKGRSVNRLTKFSSFDNPRAEFHVDGVGSALMVVDSWSARPRLWLGSVLVGGHHGRPQYSSNVVILEEDGKTLRQVSDFNAEAQEAFGDEPLRRPSGDVHDRVICDPVRERLYFSFFRSHPDVFDLVSGRHLHRLRLPGKYNDIAFDKRGYLHGQFDPGFYMPGVGRLDPDQASFLKRRWDVDKSWTVYAETPYDYGEEVKEWAGVIPVRSQQGAKYFQDGFGVNMRGDLAVQSNIYNVPRMQEEGFSTAWGVRQQGAQRAGGGWFYGDGDPYQAFLRIFSEMEKRGEEVYFIRRQPGLPLSAASVWTYDRTGELREAVAVIARKLVVGLHMDEDGFLYFSNDGALLKDGKEFLHGRGGNIGTDDLINRYNGTPVTYTVMKTKPTQVRWRIRNAPVPMDPLPDRPPDLRRRGPFGMMGGERDEMWVEGAEWMYAGLSPAVPESCTCPATRFHLDWYKRLYVPEGYRRSIGILDTNGNLIMHLGRYGNLDDALAMKAGSPDIRLTLPRFVGGTDNYLAFDDWGERLIVLKLDYHAEAAVPMAESVLRE